VDKDEVRSSTGRLFHVAGPDTAKSRSPIVVLVRGKASVPLSADRSCHLPTTDETGMHTSARYDGARPRRLLLHVLMIYATDSIVSVCVCADELSVVKCLVQLTLTLARHHSSAIELCRDVARDLHICVGDVDQVTR